MIGNIPNNVCIHPKMLNVNLRQYKYYSVSQMCIFSLYISNKLAAAVDLSNLTLHAVRCDHYM